ncbi:uncharacterized protein MELLADRAFT_93037 [Melampsora larici-populina 98AG31]|uniref:Uncharacterized protein n=1 Tax=Melampsora larici-populina (strain 98AG31 / pathotype 3-4-7) TaxID=747676 RepID=F4S3P4_MELLP|nr:uncharacterized protein MELLADRAFT_93037 [Melampsora larici-populina 98AG31]EGG00760.1 hypothetical protein MELLADRAFT_93037 [Melampsora larici-populina 98AG31]
MNENPYHSGIPAHTNLATSQAQGSGQQVTQHQPNQSNFHHQQIQNHGHIHDHGHNHFLQQNQTQQVQHDMYSYYHDSRDNYDNNHTNYDHSQRHGNSRYPPGLTPNSQQIQIQTPHSNSLQTSEQIQAHHPHEANTLTAAGTNNLTGIVFPGVNPRVASVRALELHPSVIRQMNQSVEVPLPGQASGTTCPENHPPRVTQKRNTGRRRQDPPRSAPTTAPTSTTTPTSTQTPASTSTRAIVNLFLPKSLRGERDSEKSPSINLPTAEDMMKRSSVELRALASKHAKGSSVPPALTDLFMRLHDEFDKVLAINCINNQVAVPAVHKLWGVKESRKGAHKYQRFTQSEEVREMYRNASGVATGEGSKLALTRWRGMSQAEQDSYKVENQPINEPVNVASSSIESVPDVESNNTRGKNQSMASARVAVNNFMIKWQIEANNMSATYMGDFVMMGVSNHLGNDAYQVVRATPRALKWVEHDKLCDPQKHVAAQLQAFVTGTEAGLLNLSKLKVDERARCREALSNLISLKTEGTTNKWLWKGCEEKLAIEGYYVHFAPDSKSQASDIMQDSNKLTPTQARNVLADLEHNRILILETEAGPTRKTKQKRPHHDTPTTPPVDNTPPAEAIPNASNTPPAEHSSIET